MKKLTPALFLSLFTIVPSFSAGRALAQAISSGNACNLLLKEAALRHLAAKESLDGRYDCYSESDAGNYFVLGLHYRLKKTERLCW